MMESRTRRTTRPILLPSTMRWSKVAFMVTTGRAWIEPSATTHGRGSTRPSSTTNGTRATGINGA